MLRPQASAAPTGRGERKQKSPDTLLHMLFASTFTTLFKSAPLLSVEIQQTPCLDGSTCRLGFRVPIGAFAR